MTEPLLDIVWDDVKAQSNLDKHGVAFAQAATVMLDPLALTVYDEAHSETEERWFTLGQSSEGRLLAIAHTYHMLNANTARIRLISAREATRRERQQYENEPR
ncbi:MAG: BrnT family toxin [Candidatus Thiodiazotropha sp. 6PDIVS]